MRPTCDVGQVGQVGAMAGGLAWARVHGQIVAGQDAAHEGLGCPFTAVRVTGVV